MHRRTSPLRKGILALAVLGLTGFGLTACGQSGDSSSTTGSGAPAASSDEKIAVTLITKDSINPFWIAMQNGAKQAAEANNVDLTIAAGKADGDEAGQID